MGSGSQPSGQAVRWRAILRLSQRGTEFEAMAVHYAMEEVRLHSDEARVQAGEPCEVALYDENGRAVAAPPCLARKGPR